MKYEIEVKSLLGKKAQAEELISKMEKLIPKPELVAKNKQLNHYFTGDNIITLYEKVENLFASEISEQLRDIIEKGTTLSIRTRQRDDSVFFIIKASLDKYTSDHSVSRMEFEEKVSLNLDDLDNLILDSRYDYQAKWSRERVQYKYKDFSICLDKNAGYGYLVEFEKMVSDKKDISKAKKEIISLMNELGIEELSQDRLERMFEYYNANWYKYYGTNRTFNVQ